MGGGIESTRIINDCLALDIVDSNNKITIENKMKISQKLTVLDGFNSGKSPRTELVPTLHNNKIVFFVNPVLTYITRYTVKTKSGETLKKVLDRLLPGAKKNNYSTAVNLTYIRDCKH